MYSKLFFFFQPIFAFFLCYITRESWWNYWISCRTILNVERNKNDIFWRNGIIIARKTVEKNMEKESKLKIIFMRIHERCRLRKHTICTSLVKVLLNITCQEKQNHRIIKDSSYNFYQHMNIVKNISSLLHFLSYLGRSFMISWLLIRYKLCL